MAATLIAKIRGLSDDMRGLLKGLGIKDNEQLLALVRTAADRANLAEKLGVSAQTILEWANRADLMRIDGIGGVFSDLLEVAGVDTVKELATRRPDNLHAKLLETNADKKVAGRIPTFQMVQNWVEEAKKLPRMLEY